MRRSLDAHSSFHRVELTHGAEEAVAAVPVDPVRMEFGRAATVAHHDLEEHSSLPWMSGYLGEAVVARCSSSAGRGQRASTHLCRLTLPHSRQRAVIASGSHWLAGEEAAVALQPALEKAREMKLVPSRWRQTSCSC